MTSYACFSKLMTAEMLMGYLWAKTVKPEVFGVMIGAVPNPEIAENKMGVVGAAPR